MAEKLRLPNRVRAAFQSARKEHLTQKELAYAVGLDEELVGHYETGRRPVPKQRFWEMVRKSACTDDDALAWWRLAIQERIAELLADGGMPDDDRAHVVRTIERFWSRTEDQGAPPRQARTA